MDYVFLQILTAVGVFMALISFSYSPYCIIQYRARKRSTNQISRRISTGQQQKQIPVLSLCNCFAAGVFLATCFLGMVPHVREHLAEWNESQKRTTTIDEENHSITTTTTTIGHNSHGEKHSPPWTEILLMGGFLMILLIEELINVCQRYCTCCRRRRAQKHQHHHHVGAVDRVRPLPIGAAENEPLMSDEDSGTNHHHVNILEGGKPAPDSPVDLLRMSEMDGQLRGRGSTNANHGHHHHVDASMILTEGTRSLSWRSVALLLGLGIHGVFEGVALGLQDNSQALFGLLFGVMSHEALCAIAFGINLAGHRASAGVAFLTVVLFSLSIPFGMVAGFVVSRRKEAMGGGEMVRIALEGLAAGTFVYVAFMDMLAHELAHGHDDENQDGQRWRLAKVVCVCAGFLLFLGLTFIA